MKTCKWLMLMLVAVMITTGCGKSDAEEEATTPTRTMEMLTIQFQSQDKATDTTIQICTKQGKLMWMLNFADMGVQKGSYDVMFDLEDKYDTLAKVASQNMPEMDDENDNGMGDYSITISYRYRMKSADDDQNMIEEIVLASDKAKNLRPFLKASNILHILPASVKGFPPTDKKYWYRNTMRSGEMIMDKGPGTMDEKGGMSKTRPNEMDKDYDRVP